MDSGKYNRTELASGCLQKTTNLAFRPSHEGRCPKTAIVVNDPKWTLMSEEVQDLKQSLTKSSDVERLVPGGQKTPA